MKRIYQLFILTLILSSCQGTDYKISDLNLQAKNYLSSNLDSAIYFANSALKGSTNPEDQYLSYFTIGYAYDLKKQKQLAIENYYKALALIPRNDQFNADFRSLNLNIGIILKHHDHFDDAIKHYELAKTYSAPGKEKSKALYFIALAYLESNREIMATEFLLESLDEAKESEDLKRQAKVFNQLGVLHRRMGKPAEAREYFYEITLHDNYKGYKTYWTKAFHNIATTYVDEENLDEAIKMYNVALSHSTKDSDRFFAYKDLGECYMKLGDDDKSMEYLTLADGMFDQVTPNAANSRIYFFMSQIMDDPKAKDAYVVQYDYLLQRFLEDSKEVKEKLKIANFDLIIKKWETEEQYRLKMLQIKIGALIFVALVALFFIIRKRMNKVAALNELHLILSRKRI
ncbi:MAG: tetratricopeptide repeat protein [bacterium]|nr:tetratricopeptide repeat protein [bacterium]